MLGELSGRRFATGSAASARLSANPGTGFDASASAAISAKLCPDLANSIAVWSGSNCALSKGCLSSRRLASARYIAFCDASNLRRLHGISTCLGVTSVTSPTAPCAARYLDRSERAWLLSAPEIFAGPPLTTTTILPLRSSPAKSS